MSKIANKIFFLSIVFTLSFHFFLNYLFQDTIDFIFLNDVSHKATSEDFYIDGNTNIFACIGDFECAEQYRRKIRTEIVRDKISSVGVFNKEGEMLFSEYSTELDKLINSYALSKVKNTDSEIVSFVSDKKIGFFVFKAIPLIDFSSYSESELGTLEGEFFSDGYVILNYDYSNFFLRLKELAFFVEIFFCVLIFFYCFLICKYPSDFNKPIISFYKKSNALEDQIKEIQAKEEEKSKFFASFSHELRTPLNSIIGFSEILSKKSDSIAEDKIKSYAENINNSGNYLLSIINDLMDYFKLEVHGVSVVLSEVNVKSVVENSINMLKVKAEEKDISLNFFIEDNDLLIEGDASRLQQVLVNLISNAIKFTPNKGKVEIIVKKVDEKKLAFEISDNGIGVKENDIPKIFSAFGQVDAERKKAVTNAKSTGLGMNIAKQLTELMNGEMIFESRFNVGTKVTIIMHRLENKPSA